MAATGVEHKDSQIADDDDEPETTVQHQEDLLPQAKSEEALAVNTPSGPTKNSTLSEISLSPQTIEEEPKAK